MNAIDHTREGEEMSESSSNPLPNKPWMFIANTGNYRRSDGVYVSSEEVQYNRMPPTFDPLGQAQAAFEEGMSTVRGRETMHRWLDEFVAHRETLPNNNGSDSKEAHDVKSTQ